MSSKKPAAKAAPKAAPKAAAKPGAKPAAKPAAKAGAKAAPAAIAAPAKPPLPEVEITLKELMKVLNDSEGKIKDSGRWPMIVDENERAIVFLRHRDCNLLNVYEQLEMNAEPIRRGLLGAIRYGKPFVINMGELPNVDVVMDRFNEVMDNLYDLVLTKKILEDDLYMKLVRPNDDADFQHLFAVGEAFNVIFLTSNANPSDDSKSKLLIFRVA